MTDYTTIEYEAGACFGFCPIYKMTINSDRSAILDAERFNFTIGNSKDDFSKPREGTFKAVISKEDYQKLITLANAADVKTLKDSYIDKQIMDASKVDLRVFFTDGTKKEIQLSAGEKPEKLIAFYSYIDELKKKQKWEKVK